MARFQPHAEWTFKTREKAILGFSVRLVAFLLNTLKNLLKKKKESKHENFLETLKTDNQRGKYVDIKQRNANISHI